MTALFWGHCVISSSQALAQGHLNDGYKRSDVVSSACDGFSTWWKIYPYKMKGHIAAGKSYLVMKAETVKGFTKGKGGGTMEVESHQLSSRNARFFQKVYANRGNAGVPVLFNAAGLIPVVGSSIGAGITFLDWAMRNAKSTTTARDISVLIGSGGEIVRVFSIWERKKNQTWITMSNLFRTTVNHKSRSYLLCTSSFPLQIK